MTAWAVTAENERRISVSVSNDGKIRTGFAPMLYLYVSIRGILTMIWKSPTDRIRDLILYCRVAALQIGPFVILDESTASNP